MIIYLSVFHNNLCVTQEVDYTVEPLNGGHGHFVHYRGAVLFLEGPLSEVPQFNTLTNR